MPAEFTYERGVRFSETDMAGVMHFANYYRWMEDCEHAFWQSLGMSVVLGGSGPKISWPRVQCTCHYKRPVRFEDEVQLRLRLTRMGGKSITFAIDFFHDDQPVASGELSAVCCRMESGRFEAIEIPSEVREKLAPYVGPKEQA